MGVLRARVPGSAHTVETAPVAFELVCDPPERPDDASGEVVEPAAESNSDPSGCAGGASGLMLVPVAVTLARRRAIADDPG